jgi:glutamate synthase domain-containing protein 3
MVALERLEQPDDLRCVRGLIEEHVTLTGSAIGERLLSDWHSTANRFVVVMPRDFKAAQIATETRKHGATVLDVQPDAPSLRVSVART